MLGKFNHRGNEAAGTAPYAAVSIGQPRPGPFTIEKRTNVDLPKPRKISDDILREFETHFMPVTVQFHESVENTHLNAQISQAELTAHFKIQISRALGLPLGSPILYKPNHLVPTAQEFVFMVTGGNPRCHPLNACFGHAYQPGQYFPVLFSFHSSYILHDKKMGTISTDVYSFLSQNTSTLRSLRRQASRKTLSLLGQILSMIQ
jgi:hypothetical protein